MDLRKENIDGKMSWHAIMKHYKPDITEKEADYILWNETCYPFDNEITLSQINEYFTQTFGK